VIFVQQPTFFCEKVLVNIINMTDLGPDVKAFDIFRKYSENHPIEIVPQGKLIGEKVNFDFSPEYKLDLRSGGLFRDPIAAEANNVLEAGDEARVDGLESDAQTCIVVNALLKEHNFLGAEYFLGRKLTPDEVQSQFVQTLLKPLPIPKDDAREALLKLQAAAQAYENAGPYSKAAAAAVVASVVTPVPIPVHTPLPMPVSVLTAAATPLPQGFSSEDETDSDDDVTAAPATPPRFATPLQRINKLIVKSSTAHSYTAIPFQSYDPSLTYFLPQIYGVAKEMIEAYPVVEGLFAKNSKWRKSDWENALSEAIDVIDSLPSAVPGPVMSSSVAPNASKKKSKLGAPGRVPVTSSSQAASSSRLSGSSSGRGVSPDVDPKKGFFKANRRNAADWVRFGPRYLLNKRKLMDTNELALVYPNGCKPNLVRNQSVSSTLKDCLMQYLNGDIMDTMELTPQEGTYLKWLWANSGMPGKTVPKEYKMLPKYVGPVSGMKERLKVLLGEVTSGNDNSALLVEVRELRNRLQASQALSEAQLRQLDSFLA
jgi:hypothetical protein